MASLSLTDMLLNKSAKSLHLDLFKVVCMRRPNCIYWFLHEYILFRDFIYTYRVAQKHWHTFRTPYK